MTLEELYQEYGKAIINFEIWQNKVMELKRKIAEELNNPKVKDKSTK